MKLVALLIAFGLSLAGACEAQQKADPNADLSVATPRWTAGKGPRVTIDAGHHNFHTVEGRFAPFAEVLRNDGMGVAGFDGPVTAASLAGTDVLVVSNALAASNVDNWTVPNPSAFSAEEITALRTWVEAGGALLLIADHMPFGGAAQDLAAAFGFRFDNSYALHEGAEVFSRANDRLIQTPVTADVTEVMSFTGSSFRAPDDATVALRLDPAFEIVTPAEAWKFEGQPRRRATTSDARLAILAVGNGRVAVAGEAAMFTAQVAGPNGERRFGLNAAGAEQNKTLLLNLMRWLAGG